MTKRCPTGPRRRALSLLLGLAAGGCLLDPGGPEYPRLGISVTDPDGTVSFSDCLTLPVLLGSRVDDEWLIADDVEVYLSATRERVTVRFVTSGQLLDEPLTVSADSLRRDYREEVLLDVPGGAQIQVLLSSTCGDDANEPQ